MVFRALTGVTLGMDEIEYLEIDFLSPPLPPPLPHSGQQACLAMLQGQTTQSLVSQRCEYM